jgi:hypothetical protein
MAADAPKEIDVTIPGWVCILRSLFHHSDVLNRGHGEGLVPSLAKTRRSASLSTSLVSIRKHEPIMARPISSSMRGRTRRLQSTWLRISPIPIQARLSLREAWNSRLGQSGTQGSDSREAHCLALSKRFVHSSLNLKPG